MRELTALAGIGGHGTANITANLVPHTADQFGRATCVERRRIVAVGDTAAALDRVERASPVPDLWAGLRRPEFDALHGNPRYERLVAALRPAPRP